MRKNTRFLHDFSNLHDFSSNIFLILSLRNALLIQVVALVIGFNESGKRSNGLFDHKIARVISFIAQPGQKVIIKVHHHTKL